jgi:hypothetical protein
LPAGGPPEDVPVRIAAQGAEWLTAELATRQRTLVFFQVFQDGNWRAEIESVRDPAVPRTRVEPWVANAVGQAVVVEPGEWRITLRYRPAWLPIGGALSLAGWAAVGVMLLPRRRAARTARGAAGA